MTEITTDVIIEYLKKMVEQKIPVAKEEWLSVSFKLNLLLVDEVKLLHQMQQDVAKKKLMILNAQEKRNVAAAELEVEASDEHRLMKDQDSKIDIINQFIQISKKSSESAF